MWRRPGFPDCTERGSVRTSSIPSSLLTARSTCEGFTSVSSHQSKQIDGADWSSELPEKFIWNCLHFLLSLYCLWSFRFEIVINQHDVIKISIYQRDIIVFFLHLGSPENNTFVHIFQLLYVKMPWNMKPMETFYQLKPSSILNISNYSHFIKLGIFWCYWHQSGGWFSLVCFLCTTSQDMIHNIVLDICHHNQILQLIQHK